VEDLGADDLDFSAPLVSMEMSGDLTPAPEPCGFMLFGIGLVMLGLIRRKFTLL